ncbi:ABC transporter permease [Planotetraspora kaengkrachanensis]|uniref:ABC transporter permease n=1 Tax=Planotetraspora kaengkrachanensis TaxID=575193 RepID=A0A8J3M178_9ACTN|nr:ABC transporter permease [Planotetraspora kaengkrachanensis]GIG77499.1 ABC transporter permease [Planotetraspora kaengkrachanensis]
MMTAHQGPPRLSPARMAPRDVVRVGAAGLRTRPTRALLSALGIAIGIAAMVAVVGISSSSRAELDRQLAAFGTNLLTVSPGQTIGGQDAQLPAEAEAMIARIGPVTAVSAIGAIHNAKVYRSDRIPKVETNGLSVLAARVSLPQTVGATLRSGAWLNGVTGRYPVAVLGASAAKRLGIGRPSLQAEILVGGERFTVIGVLDEAALAPELDSAVLIGWKIAADAFRFDGRATTVYTRSQDSQVEAVRAVSAATANPESPGDVQVSRPSDVLAARRAADATLNGLLLGLGAVALLVGGIGVANTMVISVLERRAEIGLRRSLGATRGQIRVQFLAESLLLSMLGGVGGVLLGIAVTTGYAAHQSWPSVVPVWATAGALGATVFIGGVAGLYPAIRAARLSPTEALATP